MYVGRGLRVKRVQVNILHLKSLRISAMRLMIFMANDKPRSLWKTVAFSKLLRTRIASIIPRGAMGPISSLSLDQK